MLAWCVDADSRGRLLARDTPGVAACSRARTAAPGLSCARIIPRLAARVASAGLASELSALPPAPEPMLAWCVDADSRGRLLARDTPGVAACSRARTAAP